MWILTTIIISLLIIFIMHQLWDYLKDKYSVKKTKDLVSSQIQKYKTILEEIQTNHSIPNKKEEPDSIDLKNDLEVFLQELQDGNGNKGGQTE